MSAHQGERAAFEESARLAVEAISNIRTVASLRLEGALAQRFDASLAGPYRDKSIESNFIRSGNPEQNLSRMDGSTGLPG